MHRVEFRGGPRAGETEFVDELLELLPAEGGRYRLRGRVYGFEIGFDDEPADVEHIRPAPEPSARLRPARRRTTRR